MDESTERMRGTLAEVPDHIGSRGCDSLTSRGPDEAHTDPGRGVEPPGAELKRVLRSLPVERAGIHWPDIYGQASAEPVGDRPPWAVAAATGGR